MMRGAHGHGRAAPRYHRARAPMEACAGPFDSTEALEFRHFVQGRIDARDVVQLTSCRTGAPARSDAPPCGIHFRAATGPYSA